MSVTRGVFNKHVALSATATSTASSSPTKLLIDRSMTGMGVFMLVWSLQKLNEGARASSRVRCGKHHCPLKLPREKRSIRRMQPSRMVRGVLLSQGEWKRQIVSMERRPGGIDETALLEMGSDNNPEQDQSQDDQQMQEREAIQLKYIRSARYHLGHNFTNMRSKCAWNEVPG
jgi:hypothetical protein